MKNIVNILLIVIGFTFLGFRIAEGVKFKQNVTGLLKRAADASTIDLAKEELGKALTYLEANDMTSGYTSILYQTPNEDIDFWYRNLKASHLELVNLNSESALEKTNVLIKLRETLLDTGENTKVTVPKGLAVYPNNLIWAMVMLFAVALMFIGFIRLALAADKVAKEKALENANH